ncbi:hypothetical protein A2Z53_01775 [Candidatus Giovannonibacteria bacterium RIFCSPHIGHO2_02_42_15]|uniref:Uncharacterized protein n=2 Tax=Candidatus Giovannoniibacteriota TaxID=1752738 RepID=A0A1F5VPL5_9BACT|nr:MAG: hypothetical protein UV11_C0013G0008 [Candidatus Giovannonibacteria bacterium GW2011_GWF2_42_19]OGF65406.1 MAG: hypothetical protein A2Z53_01775 [Candidatus Giovannonibacteria bacterium RIFCSPHIGHO2_02_42_15]
MPTNADGEYVRGKPDDLVEEAMLRRPRKKRYAFNEELGREKSKYAPLRPTYNRFNPRQRR